MYYGDVEEVSFGSSLAPEGHLAKCAVVFDKEGRKNKNDATYYNATFEAIEGPYVGARFFENITVDGPENYNLQKSKTIIRYILETTRQAHNDPDRYHINSLQDLNGAVVVVQFGIKVHINKEGKAMLVNEARAYCSPRPDSSSNKMFAAWAAGDQPYETDKRPALPGGSSNGSNAPTKHPAFDDEIPL